MRKTHCIFDTIFCRRSLALVLINKSHGGSFLSHSQIFADPTAGPFACFPPNPFSTPVPHTSSLLAFPPCHHYPAHP